MYDELDARGRGWTAIAAVVFWRATLSPIALIAFSYGPDERPSEPNAVMARREFRPSDAGRLLDRELVRHNRQLEHALVSRATVNVTGAPIRSPEEATTPTIAVWKQKRLCRHRPMRTRPAAKSKSNSHRCSRSCSYIAGASKSFEFLVTKNFSVVASRTAASPITVA